MGVGKLVRCAKYADAVAGLRQYKIYPTVAWRLTRSVEAAVVVLVAVGGA